MPDTWSMQGTEMFVDPTLTLYLKLLLATFLGALIGTERALLARQAAGTRTFSLVALSACLFVLIGNHVSSAYLGVVNFDPLHMAGSVVTGVGFLGAGLIIFRGDTLHGITTAAGLWIVAALGVAVGFGMYGVAIFTTLLTLVIFTGLWYVESRIKNWAVANKTIPQELDSHDKL
jgi:putative Mg2+ transporter-C (MgtC) family protein